MQAQNQNQNQDQQVQLGFEKALTMTNPEWRTAFDAQQVNQFRHFYHQGIQDMNFLNNAAAQTAALNFQSLLSTAIVTGNEELVAKMQADAEAEALAAQTQADAEVVADAPAKPVKAAKPAKGKKK